jgi:hypothetical protein
MNNNMICQPVMSTVIKGGMSVLLASVMAASVYAEGETHQGPNFTARLNMGMMAAGSSDKDVWANKADLGINGLISLEDGVKLKYEFVADFAGELNGTDGTKNVWVSGDNKQLDSGAESGDIEITTARIFVITQYGMLLIAPRTLSGQWGQLYANVDKFEYNRFHAQTGAIAMFGQVEQADDVLAYISPELLTGLRFVGAVLTVNNDNGRTSDVIAWRFVYKNGAINAGFGNVMTSGKLLPAKTDGSTGDSYNRMAFTAGYDFGQVKLGATYEMNDYGDSILTRFDTLGVTVETSLTDKVSATLGYVDKSADTDAASNTAMVGKLKYQAGKSTYYYLEGGQYDKSADNVLAGINIGF